MADVKISDLPDLGAVPADGDLAVLVDVSAGATKRVSIANLLGKAAPLTGTGRAPNSASSSGHVHQLAMAILAVSGNITLDVLTGALVIETSSSRTIQLPDPATAQGLLPVLLIDATNTSLTNPISLFQFASEKIDNVAGTRVLAENGGRWWLWSNGTDWFTVGALGGASMIKLQGLPSSAVQPTRAINAGTGLTGGGDLSADRTLSVDFGPGASKVARAVQIETLAGTSDTLADADDGKVVRCTAGTTVTITVPSGLTPGVTVEYVQEGAGQVQIAGSGVTLRHGATFDPYTAEQWSSVTVTILDTDEALVRGDLAAA